ncbi:MAG: orotate phosphoribosyltransferase [Eubacteriales bacterium]
MSDNSSYKMRTKGKNLFLRVTQGHYATNHSHLNYYIDVTMQKACVSEAKAVAEELIFYYKNSAIIDTVLCLDGMEVIGAAMASALTKDAYSGVNAYRPIYVLTPEHTTGSQLIFRDNTIPMIKDKNILIVATSVATGYTAAAAVAAVNYYGGKAIGIASIFATTDTCADIPVKSVFNPNDLPGYASYSPLECPLCKKGLPLDALINNFGCSKL